MPDNYELQDSFYPLRRNPVSRMTLADQLKATMVNPFPKPQAMNEQSPAMQPQPPTDTGQDDNIDHDMHDTINSIIDPHIKSAVGMRLQNLLSNYPTPQQYKPSTKRRVLGAIAGGLVGSTQGAEAGAKLATDVVSNPYKKALDQWTAEYKPAEAAYGLETSAEAAKYKNLDAYSQYVERMTKLDPNWIANSAAAKTRAEEQIQQPNRVALANVHEQGENTRQTLNNATSRLNTNATVAGANARNAATITSNEKLHALDLGSKEGISRLDRASREGIARRRLEFDKEVDRSKVSRVPVDQQAKARFEAENTLLSGKSGDPALRAVTKDELDKIAMTLKDKEGNIIGYTLKSRALVDPHYQGMWDIRKGQVDELMKNMLGQSFSNKPPSNTEDDNGIEPIDSEWVGGLVNQ